MGFSRRADQERFLQDYPALADQYADGFASGETKIYKYCFECGRVKPERTHHCSRCNRCHLKMDHHCPWLANCIGYRNHKYFYALLVLGTGAAIAMSGTLIAAAKGLFMANGSHHVRGYSVTATVGKVRRTHIVSGGRADLRDLFHNNADAADIRGGEQHHLDRVPPLHAGGTPAF